MHHIFITQFIDETLQCRLVEKDKSNTWHDLIHSHIRSNGFFKKKSNMRNPNSELKIINTMNFNVFVKDQTKLNRYNSELKPSTSKFREQSGAFNL